MVYLYPEFEEEYGFAGELGDYRQWVRSLDGRPDREWWIWQQTDSGSVAGIAGPVDVNVMWTREVVGAVIVLEDDFRNSPLRATVGPSCPRST